MPRPHAPLGTLGLPGLFLPVFKAGGLATCPTAPPRGERENRTPVALIAIASAFQAGTLPLGHLSMEEPGRVERPWPISRTNPHSRREGLPLAQQLQGRAVKESNLHIRIRSSESCH